MMKTEYAENGSADLPCKVLDRGNMHKAYKRVKVNKGAAGVDGMTVDKALPWLTEHGGELLQCIRYHNK